jgi:hypothetical protein
LWFLNRLEPPDVRERPQVLRYHYLEHDRSFLSVDMLALEQELDDELSPIDTGWLGEDEVIVRLIYPHWRVGTLPLSARLQPLFPTAYEAPRIRFIMIDRESGEQSPGWVVLEKRYVFGLKNWYKKHGLIPGSLVRSKREETGEVLLSAETRRSSRE